MNSNVCHRNLKPSVLLLDQHDNLVIGEFALAAWAEELKETGFPRCGTPEYLAPEILSSQAPYDGKRADVWSAGVVLYTWIAGFTPFEGTTTAELFSSIVDVNFKWSKDFSPALRDLINGILVADARKRLSIKQILAHPWMTPVAPPLQFFASPSASVRTKLSSSLKSVPSPLRNVHVSLADDSSISSSGSTISSNSSSSSSSTLPWSTSAPVGDTAKTSHISLPSLTLKIDSLTSTNSYKLNLSVATPPVSRSPARHSFSDTQNLQLPVIVANRCADVQQKRSVTPISRQWPVSIASPP